MKYRLLPTVYASILLGLLFNLLFYSHSLGINYFLYVVLVLAVTAGFVVSYQRRLSQSVMALSIVAMLFSAGLFMRASGFLQFLDVISVMYLLAMIGLLIWRPHRRLRDFTGADYLRRIVQLPVSSITEFGRVLRKASLNPKSNHATKNNMLPVLRGILISVPILLIFLLLFSSADLVFKHYVSSIFTFHVSPKLVGHLVVISVVAAFFTGLYALLFTRSAREDSHQSSTPTPRLGSIEATIVLGSVVTLFLVFVVIQLHYLFGGQSNITVAGGYTYADYARKGFFELIAVAVVAFLLLLALHTSAIRRTLQQQLVFVALCSILVLEVGLVMLSAHRRLSLYEQAYGFTELRLYSHLFIGWLVTATGILLTYIVRAQQRNLFARAIFISVIIFLAVINLINPDAFVAHENIQRFKSTGKLDVNYLGSLSTDASPALSELLSSRDQKVQRTVAARFYAQQQSASRSDQSWQAFNVSRNRAEQIWQRHQSQLDASKGYADPRER